MRQTDETNQSDEYDTWQADLGANFKVWWDSSAGLHPQRGPRDRHKPLECHDDSLETCLEEEWLTVK